MPSSKNYKRDYVQERKTEKPDRKTFRNLRNKAHRAFEQALGREVSSGMDVDHIQPLSQGGSNEASNLRIVPQGRNRSFPRTKKGRMKNG